ncbi:MAG TPA: SDR family oxidoreductase [Rubrivivax sp.]|nr:SDR family oxidoreductase [Rubrivivax sp.]
MRRIFLTGSTGTIGSAIVPRLLEDPNDRVTLLIRARDDAQLQSRLQSMRDYWGIAEHDARRQRLEALRGDIELPDFGLGAAEFDKLAASTTHLIHAAASVKLNMTIEQARATALRPTRTVLDLARRAAAAGVLRKVDLVSTVGVWGRTPGVMPERPLPEVRQFHNTYEEAKAEAEGLIWQEGAELPITVHRPSMVVGDSATGRVIHFQVFYHLCEFLSGARTYGVMPDLGVTRLDTVPVDWVAAAICWSSLQEQRTERILHLCSGPAEAIALPRLQQAVRELWRRAGRPLPRLKPVSRRLLERLVPAVGWLGGPSARRALRGLPPVLAYLGENQGFANGRSAEVLAHVGLPVPAIGSYLEPVLGYYLADAARR